MEILLAVISGFAGGIISFFVLKLEFRKSKLEKSIEIAQKFEEILSNSKFDIATILIKYRKSIYKNGDFNFISTHNDLLFNVSELKSNIEISERYERNFHYNNVELLQLVIENKSSVEDMKTLYLQQKIMDMDQSKTLSENLKEYFTEIDDKNIKIKNNRLSSEIFAYARNIFEEFISDFNSTLNKFEWISMYFNNKVANDDVVYQSLHQQFFAFVNASYVFIASRNDTPYDTYYDNVIKLYNNWNKKYKEQKKQYDKKTQDVFLKSKVSNKKFI